MTGLVCCVAGIHTLWEDKDRGVNANGIRERTRSSELYIEGSPDITTIDGRGQRVRSLRAVREAQLWEGDWLQMGPGGLESSPLFPNGAAGQRTGRAGAGWELCSRQGDHVVVG